MILNENSFRVLRNKEYSVIKRSGAADAIMMLAHMVGAIREWKASNQSTKTHTHSATYLQSPWLR